MNHIIVTTLINAEHMRMRDEFSHQMLNPTQEPVYATESSLLSRLVNLVRREEPVVASHSQRLATTSRSHGSDACSCLQKA